MLKIGNLSELYLFKIYENKNIDFKRIDSELYLENYNEVTFCLHLV